MNTDLPPMALVQLRLMAQGLTAKEAAAESRISFNTVRQYRKLIAIYFGTHSAAGAVHAAWKAGLLS